MSNIGEDLGSG